MNKKRYMSVILGLLLLIPSLAQAEEVTQQFLNIPNLSSLNPKNHNRYHHRKLPWATETMTFNQDWPTLLVIGDSITCGWYDKGKNIGFPYGYYAAKEAKLNYSNISYPGARLVSNPTLPISIHKQLSEHQDLVKKASVITIMIGINDYLRSSNIDYTKRELTRLILDIKALNPQAMIIGILPLMPYIYQPALIPKVIRPNRTGHSLFDYYLVEEEVYRTQKIPFISLYELGFKDDGIYCGDGLHPTPIQHQKMGQKLGDYLELCRPQLPIITPPEPSVSVEQVPVTQAPVGSPPVQQSPSLGFSPSAYIQAPIY